MVTALTLYGGSTASTTLTTAAAMFSGTGGSATNNSTKIGTGTKYGEICGLPQTGAWAGSTTIGSPSGLGWCWDATTLEGNQIVAGNWSATFSMRLTSSGQTVQGDLYVRAYKYKSGTYTAIGTLTKTGITLDDVGGAYDTITFSNTSFSAMSFATGEKLYMDCWFNCKTNTNGNSTLKISVQLSASTSKGVAGLSELDTPGYSSGVTTSTRTISASAALLTTNTRTIPASAALQAPNTRLISASVALQTTNTRTIPATVSLSVPTDWTQYYPTISSRLTYMSPPILRTAISSVGAWCPSGTVGTYDFTNATMQNWYWVFDQAQTLGSSVIVAVNSPSPFTATSMNFATAFADLLNYLYNTLGYTNIAYASGLSEPDTNGAAYTDYKNTIEPNLISALTTNGLLNAVGLLGPDTAMADDSWLTSASTDLKSTLAGYARHAFPTGVTDISNDTSETTVGSLVHGIATNDTSNKPIIQAEMGYAYLAPGPNVGLFQYGLEMTDYAVQLLRAGIAAPIAYILDDDMVGGTEWGMWQSSAGQTLYAARAFGGTVAYGTSGSNAQRPWFFPWSLLCRLIESGSAIYAPAQPASNDFRVVAALSPLAAWTIILVNRRAAAQSVQVSIPFAPTATSTFNQYVYAAQTPLLVDSNGFPVATGSLSVILPQGFTVSVAPNSAVFLTQEDAIVTNTFDVKRPPLQKRR